MPHRRCVAAPRELDEDLDDVTSACDGARDNGIDAQRGGDLPHGKCAPSVRDNGPVPKHAHADLGKGPGAEVKVPAFPSRGG